MTTTTDYYSQPEFAYEHKILKIIEADTLVSSLSKPIGCHITNAEDSDAIINYTLSGRTFTFQVSSGEVDCFVTIVGYK